MSSKQTDRTINIKAVDSSTSTLMGMIRTMRAVAQEIKILTTLMQLLAAAEDMTTLGATKFIRLGMLALAGGMSIAAAVSVTQQGNIIPVGQTMPGQFRTVNATGPALLHKGEIISRPEFQQKGSGGGGGVTINMNDVNLSTKRDVHETVEALGTEVFYMFRRYK